MSSKIEGTSSVSHFIPSPARRTLSARNRKRLSFAATTLGLASAWTGCSSAPQDESISSTSSALTGTVAFDSSCTTAPSPQTTPAVDPSVVVRQLGISEAYVRIAAASPAFRECLDAVMMGPTTLGLPGQTWVSGPYYACSGDPAPPTIDGVMTHVLSPDGTIISCDYTTIGTNTGGYAIVGNIDSSGREVITFGNELTSLTAPENCAYNPDGAPCVNDYTYADAAQAIGHEIMHAQGYSHVSDSVWNLNDVNVGDITGSGAMARPLTLGDFCGVAPAYTPGDGTAPTMPTSTPTPGRHPTYGSGIPYEVGQCIYDVLEWTTASGHMHDECGATFPGMDIVDSVLSGSPATATAHCVADPYTGVAYPSHAGGAPIPPHAPVSCSITPPCEPTDAITPSCTDSNANFVHLEERPAGSSGAWTRTTEYHAGSQDRACAESLYGRACSPVTVSPRTLYCGPTVHFRPIPWWQWQPFTGFGRANSELASLTHGSAMVAFAVPAAQAPKYAALGVASGDLSSAYGALGVGLLDPETGDFSALGPSSGVLPPVTGSAFAMTIGMDGLAHFVAVGGETDKGVPVGNLYDGAMTVGQTSTSTKWASASMMGGPGARTHASAVGSAAGDTVYVFGGRTPQGVTADVWAYSVKSAQWTEVAGAVAPARTDAAIAVDGTTLVIFGGKDMKGNVLGDLVVVDRTTGKSQSFATSVVPRANAAIMVDTGTVYLYGGQSTAGASDAFDMLTTYGKTLSSTSLGVAASNGSSIGFADDERLAIVPGAVPGTNAAGGDFVGTPGQLVFVAQ